MTKIAFLGLGQMGTPIAARLLNAGHHVTVWNRSAGKTRGLVDLGATVAASPADAAAGTSVAITMLATEDAVEQVLFGPDGLAAALHPGQLLIDMSTIGPRAFLSVASRLPDGVPGVDAPVRGSVPEATVGTLHVFVGATNEDFERVRPILEIFGDVRHVGEPGTGAAMKLVVNLTLGASVVAFGEALALAGTLGLDQSSVLDALAQSPIGPMVAAKRANVESGQYPPSFKLRHAAKDMRLIDEAAAVAGVELVEAHAVRETLDRAAARGAADLDFSAVIAAIVGQEPAR